MVEKYITLKNKQRWLPSLAIQMGRSYAGFSLV